MLFKKEKKVSKEDFNELDDKVWNLEQKINSALTLLGVGFSGVSGSKAVFIDKKKDKN